MTKTTRYLTTVTFEADDKEPLCVRGEIVDSDWSSVVKRAVFRALPEAGKTKWDSVVVVVEIPRHN